MEKAIKDMVNLGIGAVKLAGNEGQEVYSKLQEQINSLIADGEAATDENSVKLKSTLEKAISTYEEYEGQAKQIIEDVVARAKELNPRNEEAVAETAVA